MSWRARIGLVTAGVFFIFVGTMQVRAGHFVFINLRYHQHTFAASGIGAGIVLILFAFLPPGDWLYRRISTRRNIGSGSSRSHRSRRSS